MYRFGYWSQTIVKENKLTVNGSVPAPPPERKLEVGTPKLEVR
jgi:hypothetical protein